MGEVGLENKEGEHTNIPNQRRPQTTRSQHQKCVFYINFFSLILHVLYQIDRERCFEIAIPPKSWQFFFQRKFEVEKRDYTKEFGREIPELVNKNLKV